MTTPTLSPAAERLLLTMLAIDPTRPADRWQGRNWYACDIEDIPQGLIELEAAGLAYGRRCTPDGPRLFYQATAAGLHRAGIPANRITEITT